MVDFSFESIDSNGNKIKNHVIATYHDEEVDKDFIIYTDNTFDEQGKLKVYTAIYEEVGNSIKLIEIKDSKDKKISLEFLQDVLKEVGK